MKKGFTLMELIIVISIMSILASLATICYKYYIQRSKEHCVSSRGQEIFEAVAWSYEDSQNIIDTAKIINDVRTITGFDIHIKNVSGKVITVDYEYDYIRYDIKIDFVYNSFNIYYDSGGRLIYAY